MNSDWAEILRGCSCHHETHIQRLDHGFLSSKSGSIDLGLLHFFFFFFFFYIIDEDCCQGCCLWCSCILFVIYKEVIIDEDCCQGCCLWCSCIPLVIYREVVPTCKLSYGGSSSTLRFLCFFPDLGFPCKRLCIRLLLFISCCIGYYFLFLLVHQILPLFVESGSLFDWFAFHAFHLQVYSKCSTNCSLWSWEKSVHLGIFAWKFRSPPQPLLSASTIVIEPYAISNCIKYIFNHLINVN